mgnify:CR=1 FL=1
MSLLLSSLFIFQINSFAQNDRINKRDKNDYREIISLYPKALTSDLPPNIDHEKKIGLMVLRPPRGRYLSYIHLALSYKDKELEELRKKAHEKAKGIYRFEDPYLIIPYDYKEFEIIKSDSIRNTHFTDMMPIPNFRHWYYSFIPAFYEEAVIYLLDAKEGRFLADNCLSKSGVGLPPKWIHGYTKGLIFYKNYVFYWLEVW